MLIRTPVRILVVSGSEDERRLIADMLNEYDVFTSGGGREAIRALEERESVDLLLLDLRLPEDGFQVLAYLKGDQRFRNVRAILLTDADQGEEEIRGLKLGAVDYIRRPLHRESLRARIAVHTAVLGAGTAGGIATAGATSTAGATATAEATSTAGGTATAEATSTAGTVGIIGTAGAEQAAAGAAQMPAAGTDPEQTGLLSPPGSSVILSHLPGLAYRCRFDPDWTMLYVSQGCQTLTGYPPESLLHNRDVSYNDLIAPEYREALWNEWNRIIPNREPFKYEYEIITASGERKWVLELGQGIYGENGEVEALEGIILDISDRKAVELALKYNNEHDKWTGLYNREYLISLLEKHAGEGNTSKRALIGIYLNTVQLTANYGYQYSQNLIKRAAEALKQYAAPDRLLFYPRENRFIFYVLDYKDRSELIRLCSAISETLGSLFSLERVTGGIGIVELEPGQPETDTNMLLRRLLLASDRHVSLFGKGFKCCFYDEELEAEVNRERDIAEALMAIASDDHAGTGDELYLQYQPILNLRTGAIFGFEALARLRTKKLGPVSPLEFITIAEKTKLIVPIGEKIIVKALQFLNTLRQNGYDDISVSINISMIQLLKPDFLNRLFEIMNEMRIDRRNIGIEITESVFATDYESINDIIAEMRKAGLYIAIDDFGTGYSSLAREKELKADYMKIDKYFVDDLLQSDLNRSITGDIISMAHKLGQTTIAEGVEHASQLEYLKAHNCDKVQGYYISRPLDEREALEFLKTFQAPDA